MNCWVLTEEYNDYDQHGEYFVAVWSTKPTADQLIKKGIHANDVDRVLAGSGQKNSEYHWYLLTEQPLE